MLSIEDMSFKMVDNSGKALSEFNAKLTRGLAAVGMTAEGYAKKECPYDTGRLQNSISNEVEENNVYIGTNVEYAVYVEFNDKAKHPSGNAHFLRNAAANHSNEYKQIVEASLKS